MTTLGPVMVDVKGLTLSGEEEAFLHDPLVGGVILFARNYESPEQLKLLTTRIRGLRTPELLVAVDQEGGRVQRFRAGFTPIPAMGAVGAAHALNARHGIQLARALGVVIGAELLAHGVDFSFTPVLDVDFGVSSVIGDRSFSRDPRVIAELAGAVCDGLVESGSVAVGKHFPGHGAVSADSHIAIPVDDREYEAIAALDMAPYESLVLGRIAGVMPAHVIYPRADSQPAGFSRFWLKDVLRKRLGFSGMIFSDDLSMEGATVAGGIVDRGLAALEAGCDMILVCNAPVEARALVAGLRATAPVLDQKRATMMRGRPVSTGLELNKTYLESRAIVLASAS